MDLRDLIASASTFTETDRVLNLPVVPVVDPAAIEYGETFRLASGATWHLKVPQACSLYTIHKFGGAVLVLGVGAGKSLVAWLAGRAAGARTVVIMVRAADHKSFMNQIELYRHQFDPGDCTIHVVRYSQLSSPKQSDILDRLAPDLIVLDEAQNVVADSARTRRFERYMDAHPATTLVVMSATFFKHSITDAAGLSELALGVRSPLPHRGPHLDTWSHVLDPRGMGTADENAWFRRVIDRVGVDDQGSYLATARLAAHRRFVQSHGVVFTTDPSTDVPLHIARVSIPISPALSDMIDEMRESRVSPDGESPIETDMHLAVQARMLSLGFYTRWAWETVGGRDEEWIARRSAWRRQLGRELAEARAGYDSEKLISDAVLHQAMVDPRLLDRSTLHFTRWRWAGVEDRPVPPSVPVWVDESVIDEVVARYRDLPVILWYTHIAIEQALRSRGIQVFGGGSSGAELEAGPARCVGASIEVHGTGRNLQAWNHGVVLESPSDGLRCEQLLGRLHRQGQEHPVTYDWIITHPIMAGALGSAIENAKFIQSMQGTPQRLLSATYS